MSRSRILFVACALAVGLACTRSQRSGDGPATVTGGRDLVPAPAAAPDTPTGASAAPAPEGTATASASSGSAADPSPAAPPAPPPVAPPGRVRAAASSSSAITLDWQPPAGVPAVRYEVLRGGTVVAGATTPGTSVGGLAPGKVHCFALVSVDAAGRRSQPSAPACAETPDGGPPAAPPALLAAALSDREISVSWGPAEDDVGTVAYEVSVDGAAVARVEGTTFVDALEPARTRCYTVRALDRAGNASPPSGPTCATTPDLTPPSAPTDPEAVPDGERAMKLRWTPSTDDVAVALYEVRREGRLVGAISPAAAREAGLRPAVEYCYTVRARDAAGNASPEVGPFCARTPDLTAPTVPATIQAEALDDRRVAVRWSAATDEVGVAGYEVLRDGAAVARATATTTEDGDLSPGREYCYSVRARDAAGNASGPSRRACARTPDLTPPSVPDALRAAAVSASRIEVRWASSHDDVGVAGYELERDGVVVDRTEGATTAGHAAGLAPATESCYRVRARDAAGNRSAPSEPVCARTASAGVPSGPTELVALPRDSGVELRWTPSVDPDVVYAVYRDGTHRIGATAQTRYVALGLAVKGERPCFQVAAVDATGRESPRGLDACATVTRLASGK